MSEKIELKITSNARTQAEKYALDRGTSLDALLADIVIGISEIGDKHKPEHSLGDWRQIVLELVNKHKLPMPNGRITLRDEMYA